MNRRNFSLSLLCSPLVAPFIRAKEPVLRDNPKNLPVVKGTQIFGSLCIANLEELLRESPYYAQPYREVRTFPRNAPPENTDLYRYARVWLPADLTVDDRGGNRRICGEVCVVQYHVNAGCHSGSWINLRATPSSQCDHSSVGMHSCYTPETAPTLLDLASLPFTPGHRDQALEFSPRNGPPRWPIVTNSAALFRGIPWGLNAFGAGSRSVLTALPEKYRMTNGLFLYWGEVEVTNTAWSTGHQNYIVQPADGSTISHDGTSEADGLMFI